MEEESTKFMFHFDRHFPINDVGEIGQRLAASDALIPGWIPPAVGPFDIRAVAVDQQLHGWSTTILPDRNIVSRMARVAREGIVSKRDHPMNIAILLMAFAQAVDFEIEPGLAFHELAQRETNRAAQEELCWFRTADKGGMAQSWIDLAVGRCSGIALGDAAPVENIDLSTPIRRWCRNYVAALKIAELELLPIRPLEKLMALLNWMTHEFFLASPALFFAARYWAPSLRRAGLVKHIRAPNRDRALAGARNAAWDITYLSEFVRRIAIGLSNEQRVILATGDRLLAEVAPILLLGPEAQEGRPSVEEVMRVWWSDSSASRFCAAFFDAVQFAERNDVDDHTIAERVSNLTIKGEESLRMWLPKRQS
ncbi:hypothetical protein [Acetobacter sp.]|uniref:hypothetical protein n=1 Tax=Acetobacter sp. TaxID=440 RepID=UPI0025C44EC6|nr:hypothetical protein [Acetobacter sp.]MCH4089625.1 hypothetical protein [Acetobacter sp.]MCI1300605.1 hypothetical protein [Acetobacter sp.]MCI1316999.1 hypothetical protein [Acetobacter sp.]